MKEEDDKIEAFWRWFVQHNSFIQNSIQSESAKDRATVVEKMNNYISAKMKYIEYLAKTQKSALSEKYITGILGM